VAALVGILTFTVSTLYHLYSAKSHSVAYKFFRLDLIGISVMIVTFTTIMVYASFYAYPLIKINVMATMLLIGVCNTIVQLMPCYISDQYDCHRNVYYMTIIVICMGIATSWYLYIGT